MTFSSISSSTQFHAKSAPTVFSRSLNMSKTFPSFTTARAARPSALAAAVASVCLLWALPSWAFNSGSTGADGALNPAVNTEIQLPPSGILNYTTINIPAGVRVTFKKNGLNTPVYLLASGNVTVAGTIDVSGDNSTDTGTSGNGNQADDGIPGAGGPGGFSGGVGGRDDTQSRATIVSGGAGLGPGGGAGSYIRGNGCYGGVYYHYHGKGAAFATKGGTLYGNGYYCNDVNDFGVAQPYGSPALQPLIGGSGGGGGQGGVTYPGTGGGGGGGAILIASSGILNLTGVIISNGGSAGRIAGTGAGAQGGGGSGGAIRLIATTMTGNGTLLANGGCIFNGNSNDLVACEVSRHGGAQGRIRIEAEAITYSGSSSPAYTTDPPSSVFVSNLPVLRIASIAGTTVPANPTGNADVVLPANLTNPVTVNFETTNIPPGNTVKLRVVPSYNDFIEVLSPAITGSNASGNTSVSVNLPQGPSTLQAITSYTVTVAMGESLSRFAQNERVEKVEIIAGLKPSDSKARLITVSGKSYEVPTSILQIAGFKG
jgi:hypothetical protein